MSILRNSRIFSLTTALVVLPLLAAVPSSQQLGEDPTRRLVFGVTGWEVAVNESGELQRSLTQPFRRHEIELPIPLPTMTEYLLGEEVPESVPHIVIRGTVISDTTRCDIYPLELPFHEMFWLHCFVDMRIDEYIVGGGPPQLTVIIDSEPFGLTDPENWENITDEWIDSFGQPDRVASEYEGRELVLFLEVLSSLVVEAWIADRDIGRWSVLRGGDEIRAMSEYIRWARTDQHRSKLDRPLSELTTEIKKAAENRIAITGGRIGKDPSLPMLVTDANKLRDFFEAVGAMYEGDDATVLPPPVPGEDGPGAGYTPEDTLTQPTARSVWIRALLLTSAAVALIVSVVAMHRRRQRATDVESQNG